MQYKLIIFIFLVCTCVLNAQNWTVIWEDNFDGDHLDTSKWAHDYGTGSQYGMWGWGNGELQYYQSQNTIVSNGTAKIEVKEEPNGLIDSWNNTSYYSSSKITTKGIFDFKYGKVEARIKSIDGQGFWPAFWMLPSNGNWPCDGEIDIMEQWGNNYLTNGTTGAAHIGSCPFSQSSHFYQNFTTYISSGSYANEFHNYSIIWKEDTIKWYVDDVNIFTINPSSYFSIPSQHNWPFNSNEWYLMINLAVTSSGPNSNTVFPNQIEIDYVRVYQKNITGTTILNNKKPTIFPNPTSDFFVLDEQDFNYIKIFNIEGRLIFENILYTTKVDVNFLDPGVYIIELYDSFNIKTNNKLIIN